MKTQNNDVWLLKIIRWKFFFYICTHIMEILSADADVGPRLWSRFKKAVFSLHCVQNLIYRSWPWLLFCVTAILENNGRKAWNLRGTESAVLHFFFCSCSIENFPSLSKIALFLCPTGAINWCLSIPWPGNRAEFNWTHGDSCFVPHGAGGGGLTEEAMAALRPRSDPLASSWRDQGLYGRRLRVRSLRVTNQATL